MISMKHLALMVGVIAVLGAGTASAAPASTSFAGRLSTAAGPVDGAITLSVDIYDAPAGGSSRWTDTLTLVADDGLVYATLGTAANPLDDAVFDGAARYLEFRIGAETLSPRLPITSSPYAIRSRSAGSADLLGGTIAPDDVQLRVAGTCAAGSSIRAIAADGSVTCQTDTTGGGGTITGVTADTGLLGGGTTGTVTLSVDSAVVQVRVAGTCAAGSSIRAIHANGTVVCQTDTVGSSADDVIGNEVTGVTNDSLVRSGSGTAASPYTLRVNTTVIQSRVTGSCTIGNAIRAIAADGTVTCQAAVDGTRAAGTQASTTITITSTTAVQLASVALPGSPSGVALTAHAYWQRAQSGGGLTYEITLRSGTCTGTILGQGSWRPVTTTYYVGDTISISGFATAATSTVVLCARKVSTDAADVTVTNRGIAASW
jgi:hypothetical protein